MKQIMLASVIAACVVASPLRAEEAEDGMSLMEQGARLFFRGLSEEIEPVIEDLRDLSEQMEPALREFAQTMGPALKELMDKVGDINMYHPPEMLPNGDIILRRKDDPLPPPEPPAESPPGEVEL